MKRPAGLTALALLTTASPAAAAETITYTYDAHGRLVTVRRADGVNPDVVTGYTLDKADNRTTKTTSGSPNPGPP